MRVLLSAFALVFAGAILQGCGMKTMFGGTIATEGNYSSSNGPVPVARKAFLWTEEATRTHYDATSTWASMGGDWEDADGVERGSIPFASVSLVDDDSEKWIEVDVTDFVSRYGADFRFNQIGGTSYEFDSRESLDATKRPQLVVERGASVHVFDAVADVTINRSLTESRGEFPTLNSADGFLLRFNVTLDAAVTRVVVRLHATQNQFGSQLLQLYRP